MGIAKLLNGQNFDTGIIILLGLVFSCVIMAAANVAFERITTFNIYGLHILFIIHVGAVGVGFVAALGGLLSALLFNVTPKLIEQFR